MKTRFKFSLAVALILLASYVLHFGILLLNSPHDLTIAAGFAVFTVVFIGFPTLFWQLIKPRSEKSNDSKENTAA